LIKITISKEWFVIYTSLQRDTHIILDKAKLKINFISPSYCSHTFALTE